MIWYDQNEETTSDVPRKLRDLGLPVVRASQGFDYIVGVSGCDVAVERKTIEDYLTSKRSGHLDKQLYEYSHNFDLSYFMIIGDVFPALVSHSLSRELYISSLIGSSLKSAPDGRSGHIITVNLETQDDFVLALLYLHKKIVNHDFVRLPRVEKIKGSDDDWRMNILTSFPNIGPVRAKEILTAYGNLETFFHLLELNSLNLKIKGLTPEKISQLRNILVNKYGVG